VALETLELHDQALGLTVADHLLRRRLALAAAAQRDFVGQLRQRRSVVVL